MTTPPDFGGREIEEGVAEDLGLPPEEGGPVSHQDEATTVPWDDNEAHAPGRTCERCGKAIVPGEDVRRQPGGQWVHETCP